MKDHGLALTTKAARRATTADFALSLVAGPLAAQDSITNSPARKEITTPEPVETRRGTLSFPKGYPDRETALKLSDEMLCLHGVEAFVNSVQGVPMWALRKGFAEQGKRIHGSFA